MFPFFYLNNLKLVKLLRKKKKVTTKHTQSQQTDANLTILFQNLRCPYENKQQNK